MTYALYPIYKDRALARCSALSLSDTFSFFYTQTFGDIWNATKSLK